VSETDRTRAMIYEGRKCIEQKKAVHGRAGGRREGQEAGAAKPTGEMGQLFSPHEESI